MFLCPQPKKLELKKGYYRFPVGEEPQIFKKITSMLAQKESYRIEIDSEGVHIEAADDAGLYYGQLTVKQIMANYRGCLPYLYIYDEPDYGYRGFMIDCSRHFFSVEEIKLMIEGAAYFKLNKFHFHLTDDQGFRIEIESYPQLTAIGSVRYGSHFGKAHDDEEMYGGYYTKAQHREIVEFCKERHIEVIPEFDVPGHTSAVLASMPELSCTQEEIKPQTTSGIFPDVLCIGNDDTYKMIYAVLDELCDIFSGEYIHIGGDEVPKTHWNNCSKCQAKKDILGLKTMEELQGYFATEIADYLKKKGKKAICWNEAIRGGNVPNDNITVAWWMDKTNATLERMNSGAPVIIEKFTPYYVDYPHGMHSLRDIYLYNPRKIKGLTELGRNSIVGIESPIWTEFVPDFGKMARQCFPRWLAVAENGWNSYDKNDFPKFLKTVVFFCEILREKGITPATEEEWNILPHTRLEQTLGFVKNNLTKKVITDFFRGSNK